LRPPPLARRFPQSQAAEAPRGYRLLHGLVRISEARRGDGAKLDVVLLTSINELIATFGGNLQPSITDKMLPRSCRHHCRFEMIAARSADANDVQIWSAQHLGYICINLARQPHRFLYFRGIGRVATL